MSTRKSMIDILSTYHRETMWDFEGNLPDPEPKKVAKESICSQVFNKVFRNFFQWMQWDKFDCSSPFHDVSAHLLPKPEENLSKEIEQLENLQHNFQVNITHEQLNEVKATGSCTLSWVADISPKFFDTENPNYIVAVTQKIKSVGTILTGGLSEITSTRNSERFKRNMIIAKRIILYTQQHILFSSNYLTRSKIYRLNTNPYHLERIERTIVKTVDEIHQITLTAGRTVEKVEKTAKARKAGNCLEMGIVGAKYGKTLGASITVCRISGCHGNHVFLAVGKEKSSLFRDYPNWGEDCVGCCVWTGSCFPGNELETYLLNYTGMDIVDKRKVTLVERFDTTCQYIEGFDI
jgi:hypothetical protein